jgi:ABC-type amino acid transport substrate-binding protein
MLFRGDSGPLIVGMELAYPPFEMTDEKGQPAGGSIAATGAVAPGRTRNPVRPGSDQ